MDGTRVSVPSFFNRVLLYNFCKFVYIYINGTASAFAVILVHTQQMSCTEWFTAKEYYLCYKFNKLY